MKMNFEQSPEMLLEQQQTLLVELRHDLDQLSVFIKGNGDPTKGLLWLAADLSRLVATQSITSTGMQKDLTEHLRNSHLDAETAAATAATVARAAATEVVLAAKAARSDSSGKFMYDIGKYVLGSVLALLATAALVVFWGGLKLSIIK